MYTYGAALVMRQAEERTASPMWYMQAHILAVLYIRQPLTAPQQAPQPRHQR
eukprot:IDg1106t1